MCQVFEGKNAPDDFMEKVIIVAIADNGAIGKNNELLWHISEDMKFFRR